VNVGSFGLFYVDKQQALQHRWRIPERTLQGSALLGGWIGGMAREIHQLTYFPLLMSDQAAMKYFRHKTKKEPFRTVYFSCVALNCVGVGVAAWWLMRGGGGGLGNVGGAWNAMSRSAGNQFMPQETRTFHGKRRRK
jgi:uncharacterized membrane protein YsdA (DUF1294 family)